MVFRSRGRRNTKVDFSTSDGTMQNDSIGNRRSFQDLRVCADDIGNKLEMQPHMGVVRDDIGNCIDSSPTHMLSGVLFAIEGRKTRRRDESIPMRSGKYLVGGVNPKVSGAPVSFQLKSEEMPEGDKDIGLSNKTAFNKSDVLKRKPRQDDANEFGFSRRIRKLFDMEEDERTEYILKSDPETKRRIAAETVQAIWSKAGLKADIEAVLMGADKKASVLVSVFEDREDGGVPLMSEDAALGAVNFIVNKIVNRYPDDRIRLLVVPKDEANKVKEFYENSVSKKEVLTDKEPVQVEAC